MDGHAGHGHAHGHGHGPEDTGRRRLAVAFGITATVLVAEIVGAVWTGSLALLVDAAHMLTDSAGLLLALIAASLTLRPPTPRRTWGFRRAEVLAAAAQAAVLLAVGVYALVEGVRRLMAPPEVPADGLLVFGVIGLAANLVSIAVLAGGRSSTLNLRAAFLEVVNDALGSAAVIVSAVVIATTGWTRADAVAGMLISALIVPRTIMLLRETGSVLLESTPRGLDLDDVRAHLLELPHVREVHDLHASQIASGLPVLSAHVVVDDSCFHDGQAPGLLAALQRCVADHFPVSVAHSTFQLEPVTHRPHEGPVHP
ncbi:cation diffusion facilitator family transporter [Georgenia ruanii]|uniref:Cation diffusion facilitator family transporter n=1 Tax=Georgenia ruanii TaxID=348442 RepID=A0A7J9UTC5_9MICO|nr:cation diffusion facilitator family transporter [Georgenia ruanii]MPV87871.1 cation diffusion facilitator family transporter [Georgenia ruanii]